jgi:hypothetical protein
MTGSNEGSRPSESDAAWISRREAVRRIALLMGGAFVASGAILRGANAGLGSPDDFSQADRALLDEVGETIIPSSDIPGAKAVGIGGFMAMMVTECYEARDHAVFKKGLAAIDEASRLRFGKVFVEASAAERIALATDLDAQQKAHQMRKSKSEPAHYFRMVKELTILGYFSSEIGCTQAVRYIEVPGAFHADIPYKKGEPAWYS